MQHQQRYCPTCQTWKMCSRNSPNHVLHAILTIFTCFLWAIPWLIIAATHDSSYRCTTCGTVGS